MVSFEQELDGRVNELRREMRAEIAELEMHFLEVIAVQRARIRELETRLTKLEKNSAWNLLVEEANKMGITPEKLLKRAIADYAKKSKNRARATRPTGMLLPQEGERIC